MKRVDRFDEYMKTKGLNDNQVTKQIGLSIGTLGKSRKEGRDLSDKVIEKILNFYIDLNKVWLLTGEGDMMIKGVVQNNHNGNNINHGNVTLEDSSANKFIALLQKKDEQIDRLLAIIEKIQTP